jgi:hypothetical protein
VKLTGKKIVLSIDSGGSMRDVYDYVRRGVEPALRQLEPDQEVKIVVWQSPPQVIPEKDWAKKGDRAKLKPLDDTYASQAGQDATTNMVESMKLGGDQIIFVTAKVDFPPGLADAVAKARSGPQQVDAIWVTSSDDPNPLRKLADQTGGRFLTIPADRITKFYR